MFPPPCCSYIWRDETLLPVPATKADVFRSRALSSGDKRSLMRFLSACVSAEQGQGHLQASSLAHRRICHWSRCIEMREIDFVSTALQQRQGCILLYTATVATV